VDCFFYQVAVENLSDSIPPPPVDILSWLLFSLSHFDYLSEIASKLSVIFRFRIFFMTGKKQCDQTDLNFSVVSKPSRSISDKQQKKNRCCVTRAVFANFTVAPRVVWTVLSGAGCANQLSSRHSHCAELFNSWTLFERPNIKIRVKKICICRAGNHPWNRRSVRFHVSFVRA